MIEKWVCSIAPTIQLDWSWQLPTEPLAFPDSEETYLILGSQNGACQETLFLTLHFPPSELSCAREWQLSEAREARLTRRLNAVLPAHILLRVQYAFAQNGQDVIVRRPVLGHIRLGQTNVFDLTAEEEFRMPLDNATPARPLIEAIVNKVWQVCELQGEDKKEPLRNELGKMLVDYFCDGQLLTANQLNKILHRLAAVEKELGVAEQPITPRGSITSS
jgi:hypothetical protein